MDLFIKSNPTPASTPTYQPLSGAFFLSVKKRRLSKYFPFADYQGIPPILEIKVKKRCTA